MSASPRPLRLGAFAVSHDRVIAVDEVIPLALEVDIASGDVRAVHTWVVAPFSGRPVVNDVVLAGRSIVIASPAAGGLVYVDRDTGATTVVDLDEPIGWLVADGSTIWAVADWGEPADDDRFGRRPVVWQEPTDEEVAAHRALMASWSAARPAADDGAIYVVLPDPPDPAFDWRNDTDDGADLIGAPTSVWRIDGGRAERVDLGGELGDLVPLGNRILAVCALPTDPIIKRIHPGGGGLSYRRPASALLGTPESGFERVGAVSDSGARAFAAGERAWLLDTDESDRDRETLRLLDPSTKTISDPMPVDADRLVTLLGGDIVDLPRSAPRDSQVLRIARRDGGPATAIPIPEVSFGWSRGSVTVGREIWFRAAGDNAVVGVDVDRGVVRQVALGVDCTPYLADDEADTRATPSSMTVPVMLDVWELECCQPDAVVGERWTAHLLLGDSEPWWLEHATDSVPDDVRDFGTVEFEGSVLRSAALESGAGLVVTGPLRVAVIGVAGEQHHFRGVLGHDAHGTAEGVLHHENECTGVVRRIQGISLRREERSWHGEPAFVPVSREPPVDLTSTAARGFDTYALTIEFGPDATV